MFISVTCTDEELARGIKKEMNDKAIQILSIEDDCEYAYLLHEMLAAAWDAPFDLEHADRLSTGREWLTREKFDLVLLDLSLPDSWGFDSFAKVHNLVPNVPIIVLSGISDKKLANRAMREGARGYLIKSKIDARLLVQTIRHAISF